MTRENKTYKILVLSDLKDSTDTTLKSTVSLAKMINGTINLFHVKKPTQIVDRENQLTAKRNINEKYALTHTKIQNIITPITNEFGIDITYNFSFGNIKNEIANYIETQKPDIIVLGKRRPSTFKLLGDSITHFVLKNFNGVVMIASDVNALEPNSGISIGVLNGLENNFNLAFANQLIGSSQQPLKTFKIIKNANNITDALPKNNKKSIEFIFEQGDNAIKNLSKYLLMSKVNLLYINREDSDTFSGINLLDTNVKKVMNSLNVTLLVGGDTQK